MAARAGVNGGGGARRVGEAADAGLFDRATGLPTVAMILPRLKEVLIEQSEMGILFVDIEQFESIEAEYGWAFFDEFLRRAGEAVSGEARERFPNPILAANPFRAPTLFFFLLHRR